MSLRTPISLLLFVCVLHCTAQFNNHYEISGDKDFYTTPIYLDSAIYVNGFFRLGSTTSGNLLAKIDLNGDTLFIKKQFKDSSIFFGGNGTTLINFKNSLYSVGVYSKTSPLVNIAYVQKFNLNGDSLAYYEQTATFGLVFNGIALTQDNNLIITGYSRPSISNYDVLLMKFDTLLNPIWSQTYGGANEDVGWNVDTTNDGGYVIGGLTQSYGAGLRDAYLVKVDGLGVFQWQKTYGGTYYDGGKVVTTGPNEITLYGVENVSSTSTYSRLFLRKYNLSGILLNENLNIVYKEYINPIACVLSGNNFYFNVYCNLDTLSGNLPVANIIKTDLNGNVIFDRYYLLSQNDNYTTGMVQLPDKSLVTTGYLFSDGVSILTEDAWLFRVDSVGCFISGCNVGLEETYINNHNLNIYPNPSNAKFKLALSNPIAHGSIIITNSFGQNIYSLNIFSEAEFEINLENFPRGLYFVTVRGKEFFTTKKIILE